MSRDEVLDSLHNKGGHLGETKTLSRVQERFYWPGHADAVKLWCRNCPYCAARKTPCQESRAPLQSVRMGYPLQAIAVDIVGPFPSVQSGNMYIMVVCNYFTRWVEAFAIPNQEATCKLVEEFSCRCCEAVV